MSTLGIGIDLVEVSRIRALLERSGDRFKERVFTADEINYCDSCADAAIHYAARFAAKEATVKALGTGFTEGINWKDIEVRKNEKGAPSLCLHGRAAQVADGLGVRQTFLSLSHTDNTAGANVSLMG